MIEVISQFAGFILFAAMVAGAAYADHLIKRARFERHARTALKVASPSNVRRIH